ncbi:MAG: zinc and cadmium transporter [Candidatus Paceibacteria bacterium]|jgi:zinc and cadmium transporter
MELIYIVIASFTIMLASLAGILFVSKRLESWANRNMKYLIAFASGVFLIVAYDLIFEAFETTQNNIIVVISIIVGFLFFFVVEKIYPEAHCHHDDNSCVKSNSKRGAKKILIGDALHNTGDGILLAPVFVTDLRLGIIAAFGIFVHEFVQEISEFFVLKAAGYTNREALTKNFIVSSTILIGAVGGYYLSLFDLLVAPLIGLTAGAFIHILLVDLIPESIRHSRKEKKYFNFAAWTLLGILLILSIDMLTTH